MKFYENTFGVMQFGKKVTEEIEARMGQEAVGCDQVKENCTLHLPGC